jgi:hypothetical protein
MLVRNGRSLFDSPGVLVGLSGEMGMKGGGRNRFVGGFSQVFGGYANGHLAPSSFILPNKPGSISSYTESSASISPGVVVLTPALPMDATGGLTLVASTLQLDQVVPLIASGALTLSVDQALLSSAVNALASGGATISASAQLGGIFNVLASSSLVLTPGATLSARGFMTATAGGPDPLTPQGLANAVWGRTVEAGLTTEDILKLLSAVAAGKTQIVDLGDGLATVTFRSVDDTKDRIQASMSGSERTSITIDPS